MEITLEKIELVKDRTGVTYKEAKDALEAADGNVVDAIIAIEDSVDSQPSSRRISAKGEDLVDKVREVVKKGNVSRIMVTKDDEVVLNIPLTAGLLGVVVAPMAVLLGVVASFGFKCQVTLVKDNGELIDITDKAGNLYEDAKVKGGEVADMIKEKAPDVYETIVEKGGEAVTKAKDAAMDAADRFKSKSVDVDDIAGGVYDKASEKMDDVLDAAGEKVDGMYDKADEIQEMDDDACKEASAELPEDAEEELVDEDE
jgi:hypothetical protein